MQAKVLNRNELTIKESNHQLPEIRISFEKNNFSYTSFGNANPFLFLYTNKKSDLQ